jgi:hypothetical protein
MATRTTERVVTFRRAFSLSVLDGAQPGGTYRVETGEEQLPGLSYSAFQRVRTLPRLPRNPTPGQTRQAVEVDPGEFSAALVADSAAAQDSWHEAVRN